MAIYSKNVKGLDEAIVAFQKLDSDKTNSFVVAAARDSAELILQRAKALVPVDLGKLKAALEVKQVKMRAKKYSRIIIDQPVFTVGPKYAKMGGKKGSSGGVNYGHLVELGHKTIQGKPVQSKPYLRPAADNSKQDVINLIIKSINAALDEFGE